ncbi:MAG TPA: DUF3987 domain-containing protein [Hanamia sp.]
MKKISGFNAPIQNITKTFLIDLPELFEKIRNDKEIKGIVEELRMFDDKKKRDEYKTTRLYVVTFSGIFSKRSKEALKELSGLICIDIDKLDENAMAKVKNALERMQHLVVGYFISPSGNGYKIIIKIDCSYNHADNYIAAIEFLKSEINIPDSHFDKVCKDVARACFVSHDPEAYLNERVLVDTDFEKIPILETVKWLKEKNTSNIESQPEIINDVFSPLNRNSKLDFNHKSNVGNFYILISITKQKKGEYNNGNRHNFIQLLVSFSNQFGMDKDILKSYCIQYFKNHPQSLIEGNEFNIDKELLPIIDDVYNRYSNQFDTWIEEEIKEEMETPCFPEELYTSLPKLIAKPASLFNEQREKDLFLLGMLGVLSTWMPKIQGVYDGKLLGANLFIVISAPASSGKGTLLWARKLCKTIIANLKSKFDRLMEEYEIELREYEDAKKNNEPMQKPQKPLKQKFIIAGNVSSAAMISCIQANTHFGLIFETEADTLVNTLNNNDWGNWNDILRKCFQHEPVSLLRKKDNEDVEIENPHLSMVLSGTPSQILRLVSSIENGFFSRILFYDFPNKNVWKNVFDKNQKDFENYFDGYSVKLEQLLAPYFYEKNDDNKDVTFFEFTPEQEVLFNGWFADKQTQLSHIYGNDIIASIRRLAICFFRVALILSVLRHIETMNEDPNAYTRAKTIICNDTDYKNAELLINTLLFHTIKIFNQVKGTQRNKFNKGKRDMLLDKLPDEFNRAKAMEIATYIGIKEKTAENYIAQFINKGWLNRVEHNQYKKN